MGMAASQARLLTITARLADNELRSQTINNAKMRLATQSSQASQNYINALNNASLKFSNYDSAGNAQIQDLSYNALTAYSSYNTQYGLVNSAGQILVSEAEAAMFASSKGNLDAYLKKHGLEYTTTYFDELGALENSDYPRPFNEISVEELKKYYEGYGSYQNSKEVEDYELSYKNYLLNSNNLMKATEDSFESYLNFAGNNPKIELVGEDKTLQISTVASATTLSGALNAFKNALTGTNNATYNLNNLVANGLISESAKEDVEKRVNQYSMGTDPKTGLSAVKYTDTTGLNKSETTNSDGNTEFVYVTEDGIQITVDASGNVIACDDSTIKSEYGCTVNYGSAADGSVSFAQFMNGISYTVSGTNEDGSIWNQDYYYNYAVVDGKEQLTTTAYSSNLTDVKTQLNSVADDILYYIKMSANYENFTDKLLDPSFNSSAYGIDPNRVIPGLDRTLQEVLNSYIDSKDTFLNNIFDTSSKSTVEQHIQNNYSFEVPGEVDKDGNPVQYVVTVENLTNIDFVLKYLKAEGLTQSESFNTVIKEYLIDSMIEVNGEPKYAWVDENDTSNKGNADAKAQWYTNLFNRMKQGHKAIENGLASSSEWLAYALENGIVSMEQVDKSFRWNGLSYKTCTKITEETDTEATTKAEAEYNRAMNDIKAKDNIYDMQLKNIDTEHSSLLAEYDVIKGVIDKNVQRTFKFNQSA